MTTKTCTAKLSKAAREEGFYAHQSIIVKYSPWTSHRPPVFVASLSGNPSHKLRVSIGKIPNGLHTTEAQAAYVASQLAETLHWPLGTYRVAHIGGNNFAFSCDDTETRAFTTKPL